MNPRVPYKDTEVERAKIEHNKVRLPPKVVPL